MIFLKKILLIILVVILSLTAVGCSDETTSASKVSNPVAEEATEQAVAAEKQAAEIAATKAAEAEAAEAAKVAAEKAAKEKAEAEAKEQQPVMIVDGNYLITINLSTNKLTLFSGPVVVTEAPVVINSYSIASGKLINGISLTPTGKFTILTKVREPAWGGGGYADPVAGGSPNNPLGHYWMGLSAGSHPGSEYGIHGNIDESSIGTYASHGCIRMHNSEVPILFNTVPIGTKVWIGSSSKLTEWGVVGFN